MWRMTDIKQFLKDQNLTLGAFARMVGISPSYMSEIVSFKKEPSLRTAYDIHIASKRKIPVIYWLRDRPDQTSSQAPR